MNRTQAMVAALATLLSANGAPPSAPARPPAPRRDIVLTGEIGPADHQHYRRIPFDVPAGVSRLELTFEQTGRTDRTVVDIGLEDSSGARGWSGSNKDRIVIGTAAATPSYRPGAIPAGRWQLVLGFPNVRAHAHATFTAKVAFTIGVGAAATFPGGRRDTGDGWYRGDFHMHTAHSDGTCPSASGREVPCPVFRTLEAARARGLDFVVVTDHNTNSQADALMELAPLFDDLLLIPGREVTTFFGHANVLGTSAEIPFAVGGGTRGTITDVASAAHRSGAILSINHPSLPSGEICMGCGWTADTSWRDVDAIEIVNGGTANVAGVEVATQAVRFWEQRLDAGFKLAGIGGSDNHDATERGHWGAVGWPVTVVHAKAATPQGVLSGVLARHVYIDMTPGGRARLEVVGTAGGKPFEAGDEMDAASGPIELTAKAQDVGEPAAFRIAGPLADRATSSPRTDGERLVDRIVVRDAPTPGWLRVDLVSPTGKLLVIGSPVFLVHSRR